VNNESRIDRRRDGHHFHPIPLPVRRRAYRRRSLVPRESGAARFDLAVDDGRWGGTKEQSRTQRIEGHRGVERPARVPVLQRGDVDRRCRNRRTVRRRP
jgi:hypothetical protein